MADAVQLKRLLDSIANNDECKSWNKWRIQGRGRVINLQDANLSDIYLARANPGRANLFKASLTHTNLTKTNLKVANADGTTVVKAGTVEVDFSKVSLRVEDGKRANPGRIDRKEEDLKRANLTGVDLSDANLSYANLSKTDLCDSDLSWADLSGADLSRADFNMAYLVGANLNVANLRNADLSKARNLRQSQVEAAIGNHFTRLPDYLTYPDHWLTREQIASRDSCDKADIWRPYLDEESLKL